MTLDLVIRNGTIVDGSGMGRYRADVGVADGRIVEIGRIRAPAQRTINADGLIVAPGELGSAGDVQLLAWGDDGDHGQLRVCSRTVSAG